MKIQKMTQKIKKSESRQIGQAEITVRNYSPKSPILWNAVTSLGENKVI